MSFNAQNFKTAFNEAADVFPNDISMLIRGLVFLFFILGTILVALHWMSNAKEQKSPMMYISLRYFSLAVLLVLLTYVLFI